MMRFFSNGLFFFRTKKQTLDFEAIEKIRDYNSDKLSQIYMYA